MNKEQKKIFKQFLKENINTIDSNRLINYSKAIGLSIGSLLEAAELKKYKPAYFEMNDENEFSTGQLNEFQKNSQIRRDNIYSLIVDKFSELGKGADTEEIYDFIDYNYDKLDKLIDTIDSKELWNYFEEFRMNEPVIIDEVEDLNHSISTILKEDEKIEKVDMLELLNDITDASSTLSGLYSTLSNYKEVHIDDVEIVKAISELGNGVSLLLKKSASLINFISNKI